MLSIVMFYYTYTGMFGKSIDWLNILSFFIGVAISFLVDYCMIKSGKFKNNAYETVGIIIFIIIGAMFLIFTFAPPFIPLFKDPTNLNYGRDFR
jgi:surface polysaccharide O-acyltransferase-like enzyme